RHRLKLGASGVGQGLVGYVAASGEPHIAFDVGQDAVHFENPLLPDTRSEIALPLQAGGRVVGVLDVQSNHASAFDEQDIAALRTVADQLAVAIENVRLIDEMQRAMQESAAISGEYTRQSWQDVARSSSRQGYRYRGLGVELAPERSFEADQALQSGQPVIQSRRAADEPEAANVLAVPVKLRDQVIGVLDLRFEGQSVSPEMISLIEQVAERLALSLESARLLRTTQQSAAYQQLLSQVTTRIRRTLDVETVLKTAADQVRQVMGLPEVVIHLKSPSETNAVGES
ncbi:MAG: GAF domain-containing protein, partial [Anaerolineae bacterium]|nr:GAF domain-containing protein [Anaerolineae bacterium]